jgi:hypothetical protein
MNWLRVAVRGLARRAGHMRGLRRGRVLARRRRAPGLEACERRQLLSVLFDPDGAAPANGPVQINALDWSVGNAVGIGANQAVQNWLGGSRDPASLTFQLRYQANLAVYNRASDNAPIAPVGINTPTGFEITAVALLYEQVTNVTQSGAFATVSFAPAGAPAGDPAPFFEIWYDSSPDSSNLAGTGFQDGQQILAGSLGTASGTFTVDGSVPPGPLDQFGGTDDRPGQLTVSGIGGTVLDFAVVPLSLDRAFFIDPVLRLDFNSTNSLPFLQTEPSLAFLGYTPNLGLVNGALPIAPGGVGGPDVQFQSDGNNSLVLATPAINVQKTTNGVDTGSAPAPVVPLGGPVTFGYTVTNPGNVPLSGVALTDDAGTPGNPADDFTPTFVGGDANGNGLLDLAETWTYTATRPAALLLGTADPCQYTNVVTATATDVLAGGTFTDTATSRHEVLTAPAINLVKLTNGQDANTAPGPLVAPGSTVTFTYVVTNPGDVPLSAVTLTDDAGTPGDPADDFSPTFVGGDANGNGQLDLTETWTYTASRIAAPVVGSADPLQYTNVGRVSGTDPCDTVVTDADASNHRLSTGPGIDLEKFTNGQDTAGTPGPIVPLGGTVTFTYTVRNAGNVPLSGVTVRDDAGTPGDPADDFNATFVSGDANSNGLLDLSETWTFGATRTATLLIGAIDPCAYTNVALASGVDILGGGTVTDTDASSHQVQTRPAINLVKLSNGQDANTAPGPLVAPGSTVTFTYVVTNPGDVPLSAVTLTDDSGTPGDPADDFSPAFVGGDTNANGQLDLTETWTYTATRIAALLPGTADPRQYTNVGRVSGTDPCDTVVTDTDASNHRIAGAAGLSLVKTTAGPPVSVLDLRRYGYHARPTSLVLTFSGRLDRARAEDARNYQLVSAGRDRRIGTADDQTLTIVSAAYDPATGMVRLTPEPSRLVLRQTYRLTVSGLTDATGRPIDGDGNGTPGGNYVRVFGPESLRMAPAPTLPAPQVVPPGARGPIVPVGGLVTFTYAVRNTGDQPLSNVTVRDDAGTPGDPADDFNAGFVGGDTNDNGLLDLTETWIFSARGIAVAGQYRNTATTTGRSALGSASATGSSAYFGQCPTVIDLVRQGVHHQPTEVSLTYSTPVSRVVAQDVSRYRLTDPGRDGKFGTADDRQVALRSATLLPDGRTVTLRPAQRLNVHGLYQLTATNPCPGGPQFVGLLNRKASLGYVRHGSPAS